MAAHTALPSLYPNQRETLSAFRRAAEDMYRHLGQYLPAQLSIGRAGTELIPEAALRAGAQGLRLTFLHTEQAYFYGVVEALTLLKDPKVDSRVLPIVNEWARALQGQVHFILDDQQPLGAKEILETWLYGRAFHHDPEHRNHTKQLAELGDLAVFALQGAIMSLGLLVIALDAVIAEVLGEDFLVDTEQPGTERFF